MSLGSGSPRHLPRRPHGREAAERSARLDGTMAPLPRHFACLSGRASLCLDRRRRVRLEGPAGPSADANPMAPSCHPLRNSACPHDGAPGDQSSPRDPPATAHDASDQFAAASNDALPSEGPMDRCDLAGRKEPSDTAPSPPFIRSVGPAAIDTRLPARARLPR